MGTRALTVFEEEDGTEIAVLYRQMDGYPEGHGLELAEFLSGVKLVNGIPVGDKRRMANGMSCLAAQVIAHFKRPDQHGGFYLHAAGTRNCDEQYIYFVSGQVGEEPTIRATSCYDVSSVIFSGPASKFHKFVTGMKKLNLPLKGQP